MTARLVVCLALTAGAPAASAQPADSLVAEAHASPAGASPSEALARVRRGLDADPDDAALLEQRLRLELDGVGLELVPGPLRRQQQADTARRLVAADAGNPLGNATLGRDALREFLFYQDRVRIPFEFGGDDARVFAVAGVSPQYLRSRYLRGSFNTDLLTDTFVALDASAPGRQSGDEARRRFETAVATDPAFRDAYGPLATLGAATAAWPDVLGLATRAAAQVPDWGEPLLWAGLALYRSGDPARAEAAFDRALALLPPDEQARYQDLTDLLTPADAAAYRADPDGFARAFWAREDVRLLTPANERRAEHLARRIEADLLFGWSLAPGAQTDRGRTWARYGAPEKRTRFSGNMYCEGCPFQPNEPYDVWEYDGFRLVFSDPGRSDEYTIYTPPTSALSSADPYVQSTAVSDDYVAVDTRLRREAPQRTTYAPRRRERIPFLATAFRGADGRTDLVVAFGVPLASRPAGDAALLLRTGVFVLQDGAAAPVVERRRVRASVQADQTLPLGAGAVWVGAEALALRPGAYTVAAEFDAQDGAAVGYERGAVSVPGFGASGLQLSGLLLAASAREGAAGVLVRGGWGLVPAPIAAFPAGQPLTVYAEAYGLGLASDRSDYQVELALVPEDDRGALGRIFGRRRRGVSAQAEAQGAQSDESVVLSVDTAGQRPGAYVLALRVTDRVSGETAEATRDVTLE